MDAELTTEEQRAIDALQRLAAHWPKTLWLYATSNSLNVMRLDAGHKRAAVKVGGGIDPDYVVDSIRLPIDGGDW